MKQKVQFKFNKNIADITAISQNLNFKEGKIIDQNGKVLLDKITFSSAGDEFLLAIDMAVDGIYGFGERFDKVNQKGLQTKVQVYEKYSYQGEITYMPMPFFWTDAGFGVFIDTLPVSHYDFSENIKAYFQADSKGKLPNIYFLFGSPKEIIEQYWELTGGNPKLPPKWTFGVWMSSNRWKTQKEMDKQLELYKKHNLPMNVVVIEAWSDEETFYVWNGAQYKAKAGDESFVYEDFYFPPDAPWYDPKAFMKKLEDENLKLVLWNTSVYSDDIICIRKNGEVYQQHQNDCDYAIKNHLCVYKQNGELYRIKDGRFFGRGLIPDFTNPETKRIWFEKRKYLLDMGVAGFKTDGGEYIYEHDLVFHNGMTGLEMENGYAQSYIEAYSDFVGENGVVFARAGYTGQQKWPVQWAGDQKSTWDEFRSIIKAGLSSSLSGVPFWSFDLAGFAGTDESPMPSVDLYVRSTQMAVFAPVMQWHTEPFEGPVKKKFEGLKVNNDRSPWNMADYYEDDTLIERLRYHYNLRTNLIPYLYDMAKKATESASPLMKHLMLEYPCDKNCINIEDEFMLGSILVAPIVQEDSVDRDVYLPEGTWYDFYTGEEIDGNRMININCGKERIPVFVRAGGCVALNLDDGYELGSYVGNTMNEYQNLVFYVYGDQGEYRFRDDLGNEILVIWTADQENCQVISGSIDPEKCHIIRK